MADGSTLLQQLDSQLEKLLTDWTIYTTIIFLSLVAYLVYPLFFSPEPDTHPLLLARQATASFVRQPGESAVFRSLESPQGYPLRSGLNVKDPGAPKWSSGRDGDIRDVWKQAIAGPVDADGKSTGAAGKILTVLGKEEVVEFGLAKLTREINSVGEFVKNHAGSRVAIYLPNSVEFLVTFFAAAFYGFIPILIPPGQSLERLAEILGQTQADVLLAAAGTLPLKELVKHYAGLKQLVWVVERSSRHMDWNEVPEGFGGKTNVVAWHDIIDQEEGSASSEIPSPVSLSTEPDIIAVHEYQTDDSDRYEIVHVTQKNIVAAVAAQTSALPRNHRLGPTDVLLSLESLSNIWTLTIVLAALFSNASLALTSAATQRASYDIAFKVVSPTIVIASTGTMSQAVRDKKATASGIMHRIRNRIYARSLASGVMPKVSNVLKSPRLIYISNRAGTDQRPLESNEIFDLKILTGARIVYAFTDARVAGAIAQTNILDYQTRRNELSQHAHFGPPLSCLEIKLEETSRKAEDGTPLGRPVVSGPAAVGGEVRLHQLMTFTDSNTLCYA